MLGGEGSNLLYCDFKLSGSEGIRVRTVLVHKQPDLCKLVNPIDL